MHPWIPAYFSEYSPIYSSASALPQPPRWAYDSTYQPSREERLASLATRAQITSDLEELGKLFEYLDRTRSYLDNLQSQFVEARDKHNVWGYLTKQLPPEILSKIFLCCYVSSEDSSWAYQTLPLVCKHWESVAEGIPQLWNEQLLSTTAPWDFSLPVAERIVFFNPRVQNPFKFKSVSVRSEG
jgi:hypothetical protein